MTLRKALITLDKSFLGEPYIRLWNGIATLPSKIIQQQQHPNRFATFDHSYIGAHSYISNSLIRFYFHLAITIASLNIKEVL